MFKKIIKEIDKRLSNDEYRFRLLLLGSIILFVLIAVLALISNILNNETKLMISSISMIIFGFISAASCHFFKKQINLVGDIFIIVVTIILFLLPLESRGGNVYLIWPVVYPMWVLLLYKIKKGTIYTFAVLGILMLIYYTPFGDIERFSNYKPDIRVIGATLSTYFLVLMFETVRISLTKRLKENKERYEKLSKFDTLTGLHNRYVFNRRISKMLAANVGKKQMSLFMIDLDDFKKCNDVGGHFFGDEVLKKAAEIMKSMINEEDLICRWGGEEFVIIIEGISEQKSREKAEEIRKRLEKECFIKEDDREIEMNLTVSVGFIHFTPTEKTKAETIVALSDEYMYLAKKKGKNTVEGGAVKV